MRRCSEFPDFEISQYVYSQKILCALPMLLLRPLVTITHAISGLALMTPRNPAGSPGRDSAQIRFHFSWTEKGLQVLHTPAPLESYRLPSLLQRSLGTARKEQEAAIDLAVSEALIPLGTIANSLQRAPWGTLNVNVEPGPDRRLRVYLSISDLTFQAASDEIGVVLRRNGTLVSHGHFVRWSYHTPPLRPAGYRITLHHGNTLLIRISVELEAPSSGG